MTSWRQAAALVMLVVAALASLATSQSVTVMKSAEGTVELGPDGVARVSGVLTVIDAAARDRGKFHVLAVSRGLAGESGSVPVEGLLAIGGRGATTWEPLPISRYFNSVDVCTDDEGCSVAVDLQLRTPVGASAPGTAIQWRLDAWLLEFSDDSSFSLTVGAPNVAGSLNATASVGFASGIALGVLVVLGARLLAAKRASLLMELLATSVLIVAAAVPFLSGVRQGNDAWLGVALAVVVSGYGLAAHSFGLRPGHLVAASLMAGPLMLAAIAGNGVFRPIDVGIWFAAAGLTLVAGVVVFYQSLDLETRRMAWDRFRRSHGVSLLALSIVATVAMWSVGIAANTTRYSIPFMIIPIAGYGLLGWAFWRWLIGRPLMLVVVGIACAPLAVVGFFAASVPYMFYSGLPGLVLVSLLFIFLGGLALGIWALRWRDESEQELFSRGETPTA